MGPIACLSFSFAIMFQAQTLSNCSFWTEVERRWRLAFNVLFSSMKLAMGLLSSPYYTTKIASLGISPPMYSWMDSTSSGVRLVTAWNGISFFSLGLFPVLAWNALNSSTSTLCGLSTRPYDPSF